MAKQKNIKPLPINIWTHTSVKNFTPPRLTESEAGGGGIKGSVLTKEKAALFRPQRHAEGEGGGVEKEGGGWAQGENLHPECTFLCSSSYPLLNQEEHDTKTHSWKKSIKSANSGPYRPETQQATTSFLQCQEIYNNALQLMVQGAE